MIADVARLQALRGERAAALVSLKRAEEMARQQKVMAYDVAGVYGVLGDGTRAADALREALRTRESGLVWLDVDPRMDWARSTQQFAELAKTYRW